MGFFLKFLCIMCLSLSPSYSEEVWKIASLNWEPFSGESLVAQGKSIEKLRQLLKKAGITLVVDFYPWSRSKYLVQYFDEYVGIFPAWPEDTFEDVLLSSAVDWSQVAVMGCSHNSIEFSSIEELFKNHKVGIVKTYIYPKEIQEAIKKYPQNVDGAMNETLLLKKLSCNRHVVAITDPEVMNFLAQREGIENIIIIKILMQKELVVGFRNDEKNQKRWKILETLLKEDTLTSNSE